MVDFVKVELHRDDDLRRMWHYETVAINPEHITSLAFDCDRVARITLSDDRVVEGKLLPDDTRGPLREANPTVVPATGGEIGLSVLFDAKTVTVYGAPVVAWRVPSEGRARAVLATMEKASAVLFSDGHVFDEARGLFPDFDRWVDRLQAEDVTRKQYSFCGASPRPIKLDAAATSEASRSRYAPPAQATAKDAANRPTT